MDTLKLIRRSPVVFPLAVLAAVAMLFISEGSYWQSVNALNHLVAEREARAKVLDLRKNILDAETGQRGYLMTGRAEFLATYDTALKPINQLLADRDAHYGDNPAANAVVDKLRAQFNARLALIGSTIRLKQAGKSDLANEFLLTAFGKEQFDEIHQLGNQLLALGATSVSQGRQSVDGTLLLGRIGVITLTAIGLLALFIHLRHAAAAEALQRELKRTIQAERDQLETSSQGAPKC